MPLNKTEFLWGKKTTLGEIATPALVLVCCIDTMGLSTPSTGSRRDFPPTPFFLSPSSEASERAWLEMGHGQGEPGL